MNRKILAALTLQLVCSASWADADWGKSMHQCYSAIQLLPGNHMLRHSRDRSVKLTKKEILNPSYTYRFPLRVYPFDSYLLLDPTGMVYKASPPHVKGGTTSTEKIEAKDATSQKIIDEALASDITSLKKFFNEQSSSPDRNQYSPPPPSLYVSALRVCESTLSSFKKSAALSAVRTARAEFQQLEPADSAPSSDPVPTKEHLLQSGRVPPGDALNTIWNKPPQDEPKWHN